MYVGALYFQGTDKNVAPPTIEFDLLPAHERMVDTTASALESEPRARDRLGMALEPLLDDYDIILIDNEPSINVLTDNALRNSDGVIIPTYAEGLSVQGLDRLQKQIESIEKHFGVVNILALVINRIEHNNQSQAMVNALRDGFGEHLPIVEIRKRTPLRNSRGTEHSSNVRSGSERNSCEFYSFTFGSKHITLTNRQQSEGYLITQ